VRALDPFPRGHPSAGTLRGRFGRPLVVVGSLALFGVLPLFALGVVVTDLAGGGGGWPFREAFLSAADAVVNGESPYPGLDDPSLAKGTAYVYPPVAAQLLAAFTLVSESVAVVGFALVLVAAVVATLLVLDVRDWRCYGLALLWPPVLSAVHVENVTILMGLAAALVWRFHDRMAGGASLGVSIALKPLLWPLGPWLVATRSFVALAWAGGVASLLLLASWIGIAFTGLVEYQELLRRLSDLMDEWGYSVYALAVDLGAGHTLARVVWLVVAIGLLVSSFALTRRGDRRRGFMLAVAAVIACSPVVWLHYFALLVVVVAVAQPTLGIAWLAPFLMFGAQEVGNGTQFQTALTLVAAALTVAVALRVAPRAEPHEPRGDAVTFDYEGARRITVTRSSA
jgi:alpha-1,2-mannosyltransferase